MYVDAHTHLSNYRDKNKINEALKCINEHKIYTVDNSMELIDYKESLKYRDISKYIIPSFGIHPWKAYDYIDKLQELDFYINDTPIIGEIGLDFHWVKDKAKYESQIKVFKYFLKKAKEQNKIINIHTKGAEKEIIELLDEYNMEKVIVHWFSGEKEELQEMIKRGYYFTVSSEVFYSNKIKSIAREIPIDRLLTETDGPESENWLSGKFPMPSIISSIVYSLGEIRNLEEEEVRINVLKNFNDFILKDSSIFDKL
ncbi:TatD family deoxyribonuclease [Clostridium niameyense]|uniref:TatD family deoxyribonuclease n=1 Tax=Clostridium niameyense TaxID=1622073 RepID=A0A6M0R7S5_9CLOT|nr:TatD family hydrolase [Clostridium niameyense]NEZ45740.1 TatD family deoxyribonuclease [Clostridium niameyense]